MAKSKITRPKPQEVFYAGAHFAGAGNLEGRATRSAGPDYIPEPRPRNERGAGARPRFTEEQKAALQLRLEEWKREGHEWPRKIETRVAIVREWDEDGLKSIPDTTIDKLIVRPVRRKLP